MGRVDWADPSEPGHLRFIFEDTGEDMRDDTGDYTGKDAGVKTRMATVKMLRMTCCDRCVKTRRDACDTYEDT